jgi:glycosyltransferase involved in cell wall biosynthesis
MPTHNRADRLTRAAQSVLSQTTTEVELLIVDDASTDRTPEVTDRLADDRRVKVLRNESSLGPGGARNQGIAAATGDLLGFCDDDDTWLPGAAAAVEQVLGDRPELGFVTSWHQVVHDRTGRTVDYRGAAEFGAADLVWFNFVALPFGVIRRSYFDDLAFDPTMPTCEDWDLWLRCAQERPVGVVPRVLYSYHQHGGDRVTKEAFGIRSGRQTFLDKHKGEMTEACRLYHSAVVAEESGGRSAMFRALRSSAVTGFTASAFAGSVLATTYAMSAIGVRRGDPGLPARAVYRMLRSSRKGSAPARHRGGQ